MADCDYQKQLEELLSKREEALKLFYIDEKAGRAALREIDLKTNEIEFLAMMK